MPLVPLFIFHHSLKRGLCGGCMGRGTCVGFWDPLCIRLFNDWEVDEVERLLFWLAAKKLYVEVNDKAKWMETKSGEFRSNPCTRCWSSNPQLLSLWKLFGAVVFNQNCASLQGDCRPSSSPLYNKGARELLFSLFGISWVNHLSIWVTLVRRNEVFVRKG